MAKKVGKISIENIRKKLNKQAGVEIAIDMKEILAKEQEWIPTGSRWLDSIICKGELAGIPVGHITEVAGLSGTGKTYMALQIAAQAQKKGISVVYFDSEMALAKKSSIYFCEKIGVDTKDWIYIVPDSVEQVLESIETLISEERKWLFIWDSLAATPTRSDVEGDFNPLSSMAVKPRVLSKAFAKLQVPLGRVGATLLVLNQLKTNLDKYTAISEPYFTPGGKALVYHADLRIWLLIKGGQLKQVYKERDSGRIKTDLTTKITDEKGFQIGSQVTAKLKKSRFGTQNRECTFKIVWDVIGDVGVMDEESWLLAIKPSPQLRIVGGWHYLKMKDGTEVNFQKSSWKEKIKDKNFRDRVLEIMDKEVIEKFETREGKASDFYDIRVEDEEEEAKAHDN